MSKDSLISVLITGYKRPELLERTVSSFIRWNTYPHVELVLADDGSPSEMQQKMRLLPFNKFVFSTKNRGLGANTNRGLAACSGEYVLQLQDDWLCIGPNGFLETGLEVMKSIPELGFLRMTYQEPELTYIIQDCFGKRAVRIFDAPQANKNLFVYTDTPHLKTRAMVQLLGPYLESRYMAKTELDMRDRFNAQQVFRAGFVEDLDVFTHIGADASFNKPMPIARIGIAMDRVVGLRQLAKTIRRYKNSMKK